MLIVCAYLISFLTGLLTLRLIIKNTIDIPRDLYFSLAMVMGLGINGALTFFAFVWQGHFSRTAIILANLAWLGASAALGRWRSQQPHGPTASHQAVQAILSPPLIKRRLTIAVTAFWLTLLAVIIFLANEHPHGEWDAWALWNMKMKFLILSDRPWDAIFRQLHWHTHPDYPLLLPFINVWIYALAVDHLLRVPMITAIVLTFCSGLLLFGGLRCWIKPGWAWAASCLVMAQPFYLFNATSQYADILLAAYLLSALIALTLAVRLASMPWATMTGILLGLLIFTKNEGAVMALLLTALIIVFTLTQPALRLRWLSSLLLGLVPAALPALVFKIFLAPPNEDVLPNLTAMKFWSMHGDHWRTLADFVGREILHKRWCFVWPLLLGGFLLNVPRFLKPETVIPTAFFFCYGAIITAVYVSSATTDLAWWLENSLSRILFSVLPAAVYIFAYANFRT